MENSLTLSLSGTSSILEAQYFPPIELSPNKNYVLGLVELLTFNSIPNIDTGCNYFYIEGFLFEIPTGSYEIEDIDRYIQGRVKKVNESDIYVKEKPNIKISIKPNNNTLRCEITCNKRVYFTPPLSIAPLLGFTRRDLEPNVTHVSDLPVAILKVNALRVECNITTGAYINGQRVHTIHEFFPAVPAGYKIIEVPSQVIYLPVAVKSIDYLQLRIVDQDDHLVNFRGETITIRLHLKQA